MRLIVAAFALVLAACSPPAPTDDATADSVAAAAADSAAAPVVAVQATQLGGMWSFDRTCGMSDLVFTETGADYYDYTDPSQVISYNGAWAIAGDNHVELVVRRLDAQGAPTGDTLTYNLDLTAPVTTDLVGNFGRAGAQTQSINAKQCAFEDRE